jgi:hypothetical protein
MLDLAVIAKEFGQRPSALLGIADPVLALNFDGAALARLIEFRAEMRGAENEVERLEF